VRRRQRSVLRASPLLPPVALLFPVRQCLPSRGELGVLECAAGRADSVTLGRLTFLLVGDVGPALDLPPNVIFVPCTLAELTARSARIGGRLALANAASRFDSGVSAAKVNDLKPMFGELFAAELQPFDVWGHLQEDILLGNLSLLAAPRDLQQNDVISPYFAPLNASGVLMLYRNTRRIAQLWRTSADAQHVLTTERYQAFDEGCALDLDERTTFS